MKMSNKTRIKNWISYNKPLLIGVGITLAYLLVMLAIIYGTGNRLFVCSSGSLTNTTQETVEVQTSVGR